LTARKHYKHKPYRQLARMIVVASILHARRLHWLSAGDVVEALNANRPAVAECFRTICRDLDSLAAFGIIEKRREETDKQFCKPQIHYRWKTNGNIFLQAQAALASPMEGTA
jgi:Fe2+ or Zn2+ uptake regulation protein